MKKKKIILRCCIIILFSLILVMIFCSFHYEDGVSDVNERWLVSNNDHLELNYHALTPVELEVADDESDFIGGIGLGVWRGDEDIVLDFDSPGAWWMETPQDQLTAYVENVSFNSQNMILKVFYNYEEISFRVVGTEIYATEFLFTLAPFEAVEIPFHLDADLEPSETFSKLTVGAFLAPEQFSALEPELILHHGRMLNFEINYGEDNGELVLPVLPIAPLRQIEALMFTGLKINLDFDPPAHAAYFPPNPLEVRTGEQVELGFVAGAPDTLVTFEYSADEIVEYVYEVEEYLIIVMVNWQQVMVNGGPYIRIDETGGFGTGQHGRFFIEAPTEPGLYEVVAFLVADPVHRNNQNNFVPLEIASRFTLEVID